MNKNDDVFADYSPVYKVYNVGRVERLNVSSLIPASTDRKTGVISKDLVIFQETRVSVRMFNPLEVFENPNCKKIDLLMYCHGGGFCSGSTFLSVYNRFLNRLASKAEVMIVSVEYRKATEYPLPVAYNDCWDALLWIFSHDRENVHDVTETKGVHHIKEPWLESEKINFNRVFIGGDSSGANVAHQVALQAGLKGPGKTIAGLILIQPFFWGKDRIGTEDLRCRRDSNGVIMVNKMWAAACWGSPSSVDDPWFNPSKDPKLSMLGTRHVLISVAQDDILRERGLLYEYALKKSGWIGNVVVEEIKGEDHSFHLIKPNCTNSIELIKQIKGFISCSNCPQSKI